MPRLAPDSMSHTAFYIHGDVEIDGEVAIAPGAILIAAPGSRLVIARGACLGADVVIRVQQGDLVIEPEANIGSGVLIIGRGRIGAQACIGSGSTLIDPQVSPRTMVAPRTLVGDSSRSLDEPVGEPDQRADYSEPSEAALPEVAPEASSTTGPPEPEMNGHSQNGNGQNGNGAGLSHVYGRDQVQQLLKTLFPHRELLGATPPAGSE